MPRYSVENVLDNPLESRVGIRIMEGNRRKFLHFFQDAEPEDLTDLLCDVITQLNDELTKIKEGK